MLGSVSPTISLSVSHHSWPFPVSISNTCSTVLSLFLSLSLCFLCLTLWISHHVTTWTFPHLRLFLSLPPVCLSVCLSMSPAPLRTSLSPFLSLRTPVSLSPLLVSLPVSSSHISSLLSSIPTPAQGPPAELHGLRRRRRSLPGPGALEAPEGGMEEVLASLTSLSFELEQMRRPPGTAERPGLVCSELYRNHPHLPDGEVPPWRGRAGSPGVPSSLTHPHLALRQGSTGLTPTRAVRGMRSGFSATSRQEERPVSTRTRSLRQ